MNIDTTTYSNKGYVSVYFEGEDYLFTSVDKAQAFINEQEA